MTRPECDYWWNQGCFLTHFSLKPASDLTLMEAASAARTVSFTAWLSFWALKTSMSMASASSSVSMVAVIMVAFTVDITRSCVPRVGIFSQTWKEIIFCKAIKIIQLGTNTRTRQSRTVDALLQTCSSLFMNVEWWYVWGLTEEGRRAWHKRERTGYLQTFGILAGAPDWPETIFWPAHWPCDCELGACGVHLTCAAADRMFLLI